MLVQLSNHSIKSLLWDYCSANGEADSFRKCWAKWLCTDCIAPYVKREKNPPYIQDNCPRKELYAYSLKQLIFYYHNDIEKFKKIITNFYRYK